MKPVQIGAVGRQFFDTVPEHSAEAAGNSGVFVVSSAALISFVESACGRAIEFCYEPGEVTIGIGFNMKHIAPAAIGSRIEAVGKVTAVEGKMIDFEIQANESGRPLMTGSHRRVVAQLEEFLGQSALALGTQRAGEG